MFISDRQRKSKKVSEIHFPTISRSKFTDLVNSKKTQSLGKNGCRQKCLDKTLVKITSSNKGRNRRGRPRLNYNKHTENITSITTAEMQRKALNRGKRTRDVVGRFDPKPLR